MKVTKKTRLLAKVGPMVESSDGVVKIMSAESGTTGAEEPIPYTEGIVLRGEGLYSTGAAPLELPENILAGGKAFHPEGWSFWNDHIEFGLWCDDLPAPGIYYAAIPITYKSVGGGATETLNLRVRIKVS